MNFMEAFNVLATGAYVTRIGWTDSSFLVLLPGIPSPWRVVTVPNPAAGNWQGLRDDYLSEDWVIFVNVPCFVGLVANKPEEKEVA